MLLQLPTLLSRARSFPSHARSPFIFRSGIEIQRATGKKDERIFTYFLHPGQRIHPWARSFFWEFRYLRISGERERQNEWEKEDRRLLECKEIARKVFRKCGQAWNSLIAHARGRALVGKSLFQGYWGLFQRASLIIVARISFHKTGFAREISLRFFVSESWRSLRTLGKTRLIFICAGK